MKKVFRLPRAILRRLFYFFSVFFLLLNLASTPSLLPVQQGQITATINPDTTLTDRPTETLPIQTTETLTPTFTETPQLTIFPTATVTSSISDQSLNGDFVSDEVLVRFRRIASGESIDQCIRSINAVVESEIEALTVFLLNVQTGKIAETIYDLQQCPDFLYAEPNYLAGIADTIPSDPNLNLQYGLVNIHAPQGWDLTTGSTSVTIAIVDTGVDLAHPDLAGKIVGGYDFVNNDSVAQDDNGHGTHVAGIAAAISNNGTGVAGVSWGARIMPVKVLNAGGGGTFATVAAGIVWAADNGAQVINLSLGGPTASLVLQNAVDYAYNKGIVLVAASGNTGANLVLYPAHYPNVIAVAATDSTNTRAGFSNYGPEVDLAAPGVAIYSTFIGGGYTYLSGTSMSAPFVSGLAAILYGSPGYGSPDVVALKMESTALDLGPVGFDNFYGYGLIQMDSALQFLQTPTPTVSATSTTSSISVHSGFSTSLPMLIATRLPTLTPTSSFTSLPFTPTWTVSPTLLPGATSTMGLSETPEVIALETQTPAPTSTYPNWWLPCCGLLLILLGLFLFWVGYRQQNKNRKRRLQF